MKEWELYIIVSFANIAFAKISHKSPLDKPGKLGVWQQNLFWIKLSLTANLFIFFISNRNTFLYFFQCLIFKHFVYNTWRNIKPCLYVVRQLLSLIPPLANIQKKSELPQWLQVDPLSRIIFSPPRLQESPLCVSHKGHLCYKTPHGSMLSYGKLSKLPISLYYPDRRQKVLGCVFPVH